MKCENCKENKANVRYTQVINGEKIQMNLCDKCAKELGIDKLELGIDDMNLGLSDSFSSLFRGMDDMFEMYEKSMPRLMSSNNLAFNNGMSLFDDFFDTDRFFTNDSSLFNNNFSLFGTNMNQLLRNRDTQSDSAKQIEKLLNNESGEDHIIKDTKENTKQNSKSNQLQKLQQRLEKEIAEERYEDAAKTRDEIKKLEK